MSQKLTLNNKNKAYQLTDSPFHKLSSKKKLAILLRTPLSQIRSLRVDSGNYSEFESIGKSGKIRKIQKPSRNLDVVHTRIASLLIRIITPEYLHSGKKGYSNVTNANIHLNTNALMTSDIKSFYPSTSWNMIFSFFYSVMSCSADIAEILADLCTCHKHLPTGSRISMPLAYWANVRMFNELENICQKHDVIMTVYVDDLTFSGKNVNRLFKSTVKKIISRYGHEMHPTKTKLYPPNGTKLVTGVVIDRNNLLVRNEQHFKLFEELSMWNAIKNNQYAISMSITSKLIGRLHSMGTIEPKYKTKAKSVRKSTAI
ncbi:RNA-directed DNA polymerase [Providencia rettgeri]|uniref:reverse transcriptase family protein n=1 Tax=Providencia sp. PROV269 TaxID=2949957 RepID=UPI00234BB678|nr:reverse transcriptase family protein [Providencia sp. PROV269]ELR5297430.1 RNA-directed DNA polymerase [Providencia rettgeri]ELR5298075.1 RNA-directed DNA polymerase [Providencia rettgeri]MCL0013879.1 reverse transcriptase family protein [Providencia rettgeri]